jgi:hypothetical protein
MMKLAPLCIAVILCAPTARGDDPPAPEGRCFLKMADGRLPVLWPERVDLATAADALRVGGEAGWARLRGFRGAEELAAGTRVWATAKDAPGGRFVRVETGPAAGRGGWVERRFLGPVVEPAVVAKPAPRPEASASRPVDDRTRAERAREIERRIELRKARRAALAAHVDMPMPTLYFSPATSGAPGPSTFRAMPGTAGNPIMPSFACGAPTLTTGQPCRNMVSGGGYCYLHR